jgi:tyrosyl-tRNA synthetase
LDLLVKTGLATSKGEAKRAVKANSVTMNREKVTDEGAVVSSLAFGSHKVILLGVGKSNLHLVMKG